MKNIMRRPIGLGRLLLVALLGLIGAGWSGGALAQSTSTTMLSGYVFAYDGSRVAGATVTIYKLPEHTATGMTVKTNANGEWSLDTGAGTFAVRAEREGYEFAEQTVYAQSYEVGITLLLRPVAANLSEPLVATVSGQVTSANGVPLGGVNIVATNAQDTGVRQQQPPPILSATVTDESGRYSLRVPAGTVWLTVKTGAAWGYQLNPFNINQGQTLAQQDFVVQVRVLPRSEFPTATVPPAGVNLRALESRLSST